MRFHEGPRLSTLLGESEQRAMRAVPARVPQEDAGRTGHLLRRQRFDALHMQGADLLPAGFDTPSQARDAVRVARSVWPD